MTRWRAPAPGEQEAGERSWEIIRNAYDERLPTTLVNEGGTCFLILRKAMWPSGSELRYS